MKKSGRFILLAILWVLILHPVIHAADNHAHSLEQEHEVSDCLLCGFHPVTPPPVRVAQAEPIEESQYIPAKQPVLQRTTVRSRERAPPVTLSQPTV